MKRAISPALAWGRGGQMLPGTVLLTLVLVIVVTAVVSWTVQESRISVKEQRSTTAFNLAQAAINRGYWEAISSTGTFAQIQSGIAVSGYNFDKTYSDVPGGTYRVQVSSAANSSITVIGEGRDSSDNQLRQITATYQNRTIYGPLLTEGNVSYSKGLCLYWGPIMSQGTITMDATTSQWYFPQKYARGDVVGASGYARDTTWPLPPNTDNVEWWANYSQVPEVPIIDFATLRSSAAATDTLDVYGCASTSYGYLSPTTGLPVTNKKASWDNNTLYTAGVTIPAPVGQEACGTKGTVASTNPTTYWFGDSYEHPKGAGGANAGQYVWYWDGNLVLTGEDEYPGTNDTGLYGTIVVMGDLYLDSSGDYNYTGHVPANAWQQQQKLLQSTYDTASTLEYPGDDGYHKSYSTWQFGTQTFHQPGQAGNWINTVGIRGFIYVKGNLYVNSFMDINGAIWVGGSVSATCPAGSNNCLTAFCGVLYDDTLSVPTLNVVLIQTSWEEAAPSSQVWH